MRSQKIEFRQTRDFGEIINATFLFIQQNFRLFLTSILYIAGPFSLLAGLCIGIFQSYALQPLEGITYSITAIFVYVPSFLLASVTVMATVYHFVYLYMERRHFEVSDVWQRVRKDLVRLFFSTIGVAILSTLGVFLCFLPGIYLFFALIPVFSIQTKERIGFFDAISRSFKLTSGQWWRTFGLWIVMSIVQGLISFIIVSPFFVAMGVLGFLNLGKTADLPSSTFMLLYIIANSLNNILSLICGSIVFVAMAFHYFSLVEEKEGLGLMEKIRLMGTRSDETAEPDEEEEY
jgi:hypothetical protein